MGGVILRVLIGALAIVSVLAAGLYWDRGRIAHALEITEARLQAAEHDAATKAETLTALQAHTSRTLILEGQRDTTETTIRNSEGFDDEVPGIILGTITELGMR